MWCGADGLYGDTPRAAPERESALYRQLTPDPLLWLTVAHLRAHGVDADADVGGAPAGQWRPGDPAAAPPAPGAAAGAWLGAEVWDARDPRFDAAAAPRSPPVTPPALAAGRGPRPAPGPTACAPCGPASTPRPPARGPRGRGTKRGRPVRLAMGAERPAAQVARCTCAKSRCLKLYCDCYRAGQTCGADCRCVQCGNAPGAARAEAAREALANRMRAPPRLLGCRCRQSGCRRNYCVCFKAGLPCGVHCTCEGCENGTCEAHARDEARARARTEAQAAEQAAAQAQARLWAKARVKAQLARAAQAARARAAAGLPPGCRCAHSACRLNYCVCFKAGRACGAHCHCRGCENGTCNAH
jgi:hypothetical protein